MSIIKTEKEIKDDIPILQKDKRCFFIGDRVAISQVGFLIIAGILPIIFVKLNLFRFIYPFWYVFLLIVPTIVIITFVRIRQKLYITYHWTVVLIPLLIVWCSFTIYIGVWVDTLFGLGKTFWISIFLALFYIIGYIFTRLIRKFRHAISVSKMRFIVIIFSIVVILFTLIYGGIVLHKAMVNENLNGCYGDSYFPFLESLECMSAALIMISGIAIVISLGLNYPMLSDLFKNEKRNVVLDSPNKLITVCLSGTLIIMLIFWILMVFFLPPAVGGEGGGDGGGGGGGGTKSRKKGRSMLVDLEWKRYIKN